MPTPSAARHPQPPDLLAEAISRAQDCLDRAHDEWLADHHAGVVEEFRSACESLGRALPFVKPSPDDWRRSYSQKLLLRSMDVLTNPHLEISLFMKDSGWFHRVLWFLSDAHDLARPVAR